MKKVILLFFIILLISAKCYAKHLHHEKVYQKVWCDKYCGITEYKLSDKTRVDCLTKNYAVEFDFALKWAEAIGQSLYYGIMTGKKPAVVLIIEKDTDWKYFYRIKKVSEFINFTLWYMLPDDLV